MLPGSRSEIDVDLGVAAAVEDRAAPLTISIGQLVSRTSGSSRVEDWAAQRGPMITVRHISHCATAAH
jgi:hypothetical protein